MSMLADQALVPMTDLERLRRAFAEGTAAARMHLQWFAAEDEGRTEDPTEHKIRKAREEGKVAKSADLTSSVLLVFSVAALGLLASSTLATIFEMLSFYLQRIAQIDPVTDQSLYTTFLIYFARLVGPYLIVGMIGAVFGNVIQVGLLFSVKPITPDLQRIMPNIAKWLQRSFFSMEALFNLAKSIVKVVIITFIVWVNVAGEFGRLANLLKVNLLQAMAKISWITFTIMLQSAIVLLIAALADYWFQRRQHIESLKMSKQEVKEERKLYEGDPLVKSRLKERMRELLSRSMMRNVPRADVVITNPTHYAVALEYKRDSMNAPAVVAKGEDNMAQQIKKIALEHDVPVIENKPLARALYAEVDIGEIIPEQYYEAVAAVLKEVYQIGRKVG